MIKRGLAERERAVPSDGQSIADDSLTATGVLDVHCDGCRVGHVPETTLVDTMWLQ